MSKMKLVLKAEEKDGKVIVTSKGNMPFNIAAYFLVNYLHRCARGPLPNGPPQWHKVFEAIQHESILDPALEEKLRYATMGMRKPK